MNYLDNLANAIETIYVSIAFLFDVRSKGGQY